MASEGNYLGYLKPASAIMIPLYNVEKAVVNLSRLDAIDATGEIYVQNLIMKQWVGPQEIMLFDVPTTLYDFTIASANSAYGVPGYFASTASVAKESISGRTLTLSGGAGVLVAGNLAAARFAGKYFNVPPTVQAKDSVGAPPIIARENASATWSLSFWILRQASSAVSNIYDETNAGFTQRINFGLNTNGTIAINHIGGSSPGTAYTTPIGSAVPLFTWNHCVFTYDGTNIRFYLNGALSAGPTAYTRNTGLTAGDMYLNLSVTGQQYLQNLAVFQSVLSAGQISRQYLDYATTIVSDNGALITDAYSGGVFNQGGTIGQGWSGFIVWSDGIMPGVGSGAGPWVCCLPIIGVGWIRNLSSTAEYVYELKISEKAPT